MKPRVTDLHEDGQYDLNNPSDVFTRQILDAASQLEMHSVQNAVGWVNSRRSVKVSGMVDYHLSGYEIKDGKLSVHHDGEMDQGYFDRYHKGSRRRYQSRT